MHAANEEILIYKKYPRQVGRIAALAEIAKAVARIVKDDKVTPLEARRTLYKATLLYSRSPEGQNPDKTKIPHPRTWFHQGRYLDDPKEWQHGGFSGKMDRTAGNIAAAREAIADFAGTGNRTVDLLGGGQAGERNGRNLPLLHADTEHVSLDRHADRDWESGNARAPRRRDGLSRIGDDSG